MDPATRIYSCEITWICGGAARAMAVALRAPRPSARCASKSATASTSGLRGPVLAPAGPGEQGVLKKTLRDRAPGIETRLPLRQSGAASRDMDREICGPR